MIPTAKLRWVKRRIEIVGHPDICENRTVLQQWWQAFPSPHGEWRDVPVEVEE